MERRAVVERKTGETEIRISWNLDGQGKTRIATGIPFFDHMLTLFAVHGCFDLEVDCRGDIEIDWHHSVEDVGIVLGDTLAGILGDRKGLVRYGDFVLPMDETLCRLALDLSNRPFLVCLLPDPIRSCGPFDPYLAKEFFRAFAVRSGMTLHIDVPYGENSHHIVEAMFKALGRALDKAVRLDSRVTGVPSTKGLL
ncbi:imidazoleglycerol-phosphate dehydratase HisB [Desulfobotulus sp.]|jgi:imidazoleglycerol-phosphate dehydratase|uniref:imidazoleglycerol-phosphate dehydratase HisB n=1 Tax=Desulfobotulus sp. TaxID=1940337 RepID=UPI002A370385|nr:imidazoleglycerol-phosphate dehydratase HisB [Desulfobotulus sp.]MDY0162385.1 imidazoleglycerol-phosphate dehydratase HisB [Desulfobotulus sp.]